LYGVSLPQGFDIIKCGFFYIAMWIYCVFSICGDYICRSIQVLIRILGCPIYIHVPKEKRTKLDPSCRKGTFMAYNEYSMAYRIYIPGQRHIEVRRYVTFEEEIGFRISKESQMNIDSEKNEETVPSPPSIV
jgi:hypothetical protein